ncbi:odorant receptor 131-2-like [Plectropomus leopardus]|uniref:odorant receptor 131-2-like n=1 Tax=Plectropomus leopardus TaxID=160734 RepID=UPI001C4C9B23|nr:odorant receptor 131-2-like [Plectropomus leopardus]
MNSSSNGSNVSTGVIYRDSYSTAVAKNVIVVALGLTINYINGTLVHTFRKHQIFYMNPRYILFIHLVVNDMIQLTLSISLVLLSYIFYKINASLCCLIITFSIFTTLNTPLNLAVMAVECYIAICLPLRHAEFCNVKKTYILIGWIWAMSAALVLPDMFVLLATEPVQLFYSTMFCIRDNIFRHRIHMEKRDVSHIIYLISVWLTLLYTYIMIFLAAQTAKAAKAESGNTKKARNTILLHGFQLLLCMLTYIAHSVRQALLHWFPKQHLHVAFASYIVVQILPRFISPIVYGLRDQTFRQHLIRYLVCAVRTSIKPQVAAKLMLLY